jgi:dienelactone hydrolase
MITRMHELGTPLAGIRAGFVDGSFAVRAGVCVSGLPRSVPEKKVATHTDTSLPDLFRFRDGAAVQRAEEWPRRRLELLDAILPLEYGGLPPAPHATRSEELHTSVVRHLDGARTITCRVVAEFDRPFAVILYLLVPPGPGPFPVVLNGDACWGYVTDEITAEVLRRGNILAQFNRVEIAADVRDAGRDSGLYPLFPEDTFGALAAWAWGYHRCVDALAGFDFVDRTRIAVVGHSRGGKASLLAGATDERIALTAANDSGCCGAGCYRFQGPNSETLADIVGRFPYWFGPDFGDTIGREAELPFDQHFLKAAVAPRLLLTTEALGDLWANPTGAWRTHEAARQVYRFLGVAERIGIWYREGGHAHSPADWETLLDFMDWHFRGQPPVRDFAANPFGPT